MMWRYTHYSGMKNHAVESFDKGRTLCGISWGASSTHEMWEHPTADKCGRCLRLLALRKRRRHARTV